MSRLYSAVTGSPRRVAFGVPTGYAERVRILTGIFCATILLSAATRPEAKDAFAIPTESGYRIVNDLGETVARYKTDAGELWLSRDGSESARFIKLPKRWIGFAGSYAFGYDDDPVIITRVDLRDGSLVRFTFSGALRVVRPVDENQFLCVRPGASAPVALLFDVSTRKETPLMTLEKIPDTLFYDAKNSVLYVADHTVENFYIDPSRGYYAIRRPGRIVRFNVTTQERYVVSGAYASFNPRDGIFSFYREGALYTLSASGSEKSAGIEFPYLSGLDGLWAAPKALLFSSGAFVIRRVEREESSGRRKGVKMTSETIAELYRGASGRFLFEKAASAPILALDDEALRGGSR